MNTDQTSSKKLNAGKQYVCETCDKKFKCKSALVIHNRVHTRDKPFSCDICVKSFARKSDLTRHQLTHSGLKIYQCDICKKMFFIKK